MTSRKPSGRYLHSSASGGSGRQNPAFLPSPRWRTDSPARAPSSSDRLQAPSPSRDLWSPIPPPPANLYNPNQTGAFSVDPGIPFLATAGPTDAGDSSDRSSHAEDDPEHPSPTANRFVGGFVTGIKKAVRRSIRERPHPAPVFYESDPDVRDSGYASSPAAAEAPPPPPPPFHVPPPPRIIDNAPPIPNAPTEPATEIHSPQSLGSPVSANPEYGSDYAMMNPLPPKSDVSFSTYLRRFSKFVNDVSALPWVARDRVTVDYYPEKSRRENAKRLPAISWSNPAVPPPGTGLDYHLSFADPTKMSFSDAGDSMVSSTDSGLQAPHHYSRISGAGGTVLDLDEEFQALPTPYGTPGYPRIPPGLPTPGQSAVNTPVTPQPISFPELDSANANPPEAYTPKTPVSTPWGQVDTASVPAWATATPRRTTSLLAPPSPSRSAGGYANADNPWPPYQGQSPQSPRGGRSGAGFGYDDVDDYGYTPRSPGEEHWQPYPSHTAGYVPPEYAEPYYGERFGVGVHGR